MLSLGNTAVSSGDTHNFVSGPIAIDAGSTYTFNVTTTGAGVQSFISSGSTRSCPSPDRPRS